MTNPKIEKVATAIAKTKSIITDNQNKLRELERQKIKLENDEVVALFRREKLNEDEFAALLRTGRGSYNSLNSTDSYDSYESNKRCGNENGTGDFSNNVPSEYTADPLEYADGLSGNVSDRGKEGFESEADE